MKDIELYQEICEAFGENNDYFLEDVEVKVNGVNYGTVEVESLPTEDEGKYQFGGTIYGIGEIENDEIKEILFYIERDFTQTGSYYSEQIREFEQPYVVRKVIETREVWRAF